MIELGTVETVDGTLAVRTGLGAAVELLGWVGDRPAAGDPVVVLVADRGAISLGRFVAAGGQ